MSYHQRTSLAARGKWRGILLQLGLPEACLKNKHGPCPLCTSQTNFRWDNKDQSGSYICTCSAGGGMDLAIAYTGRPFAEIASEIDAMLGNVKPDAPQRPPMTDDERRKALRAVFSETAPMQHGDLAATYLLARGIHEPTFPKALRFGAALRDGEGGIRPAMVALVSDPAGTPVTLHRTFLRPDGKAKAEMAAPRKMMPGEIPDGSAVRLSDFTAGALGIAEGIETAMSACALYDMPVWAAINSAMLAKWIPPEGCDEVAIFGDHDAKFGGQAAAYALAHRLAVKGLHVTVHIPDMPGTDWADVYMKGKP